MRWEHVVKCCFFPWSIEKKFLHANAHDFSKSRLQIWDFRSSDQKSQFLSWNLTFGNQILENALLTMYIIIKNIFRFLLQLIDPQSVGEYEWDERILSRDCIATVICYYLTLLNYSTSMAFLEVVKPWDSINRYLIYNSQFLERNTQHWCYKCESIAKQLSVRNLPAVAD